MSTEAIAATKEKSHKKYTIKIFGSYSIEKIFTLLTKVIAVYIKFQVVYV